jgi:GT2 family glycosyltransferase
VSTVLAPPTTTATAWLTDVDVDALDLRDLVREHVAGLPAAARAELLETFGALLDDAGATDELAARLHAVREIVRERLPLAVIDPAARHLLHVERLHRVGPRAYVVQGWCEGEVASLAAVAPEGPRAELAARMFRYDRPDVEDFLRAHRGEGATPPFGFIAFFELGAPSRLRDGWVLELRDAEGEGVETAPVTAETDAALVRDALLRDLDVAPRRNEALRDGHVRPALAELQARRAERVVIRAVDDFGTPPADPVLSIVVPLYGDVDWVEHQLASFVDDPEMRRCELIYVLDSPELADHLHAFAGQLHELYRLPFRVATLSENGGFSLATNRGASLARAPRLLLMNSDVIPAVAGWTRRLLELYDELDGVGALAPKLLYEDEAIQHAGIYFKRRPGGREWWNEHFFKGVHRSLPAANVARRVPAVTAACLLTDRAVFERLGGLRGQYVQGDYEDTDFCLRLRAEGLDCWYVPEVELYHLEGQSYPGATRQLSSAFNRWLHTRLFDDEIEAVMAEHETKSLRFALATERGGRANGA